MLNFLQTYGSQTHSQNLEDGVVQEAVKRLGLTEGCCVEIGGNDGLWCSNTRLLIQQGWHGTFVETQFALWEQCRDNWAHNERVKCICSHVDKYNINAFVKDDTDLVSLDTDGADYDLFCAMRERPAIVIVEIDSSLEPPRDEFNADGGASYWKMVIAGLERGYFLLAHTGNLILCRQEYGHLFPECAAHPLLEWERYFNRGWVRG
jgi:hypothetical protein